MGDTFPKIMSISDHSVYIQQGFGANAGIGACPALIIVDFVEGFADPKIFGGGNIAKAIRATVDLLAFARKQHWPIAMTRIVFANDGSDANIFTKKIPGLLALTENAKASRIVAALAPQPEELVIRKRLPSAFFGTDLAAWLSARHVDTVMIAGCTTSGCVRASAVDAMSHGFLTVVVIDCVGDRALEPHEANLFDIGQKYANLISLRDLKALYVVPKQK